MENLRVELKAVNLAAFEPECGVYKAFCAAQKLCVSRKCGDAVSVGHPNGGAAGNALEQRIVLKDGKMGPAIFPRA